MTQVPIINVVTAPPAQVEWNPQECVALCSQLGRVGAKEAIDSLVQLLFQSSYHAMRYNAILGSIKGYVGQVDNKFGELMYEASFELRAVAWSLHAQRDIVSQLVNIALALGIATDRCGLPKVRDKIGECEVLKAINSVTCDPHYVYVESLVNMIKHQNVIGHSLRSEGCADGGFLDIVLHPFEYKGRTFAQRRGDDLVGPIKDGFVRCISTIGAALNRDLQQQVT